MAQREVYDLAREQVERNTELLTAGRSFRDLSHQAWIPSIDDYRHYCCLFHGVGQCDEYPEIFVPDTWDELGFDDTLEAGMVLTVESYVGRRDGAGEGVKLENQVLVTDTGPELLTRLPLDLD